MNRGISNKMNDAKTIAKFIYEDIMTRFGCPIELLNHRCVHFLHGK